MAKSIDAVIKATLEKKIGKQVWKVLKDHIDKDVYDVYTPNGRWVWGTPQDSATNGYQRRRKTGLLNESDKYINVDHAAGTNMWSLRVSTNAHPSKSVLGDTWNHHVGGFLRLLEEGDLGFWTSSQSQNMTRKGERKRFPRPVITNAQEEADRNKSKYEADLYAAINKAISKIGRGSK